MSIIPPPLPAPVAERRWRVATALARTAAWLTVAVFGLLLLAWLTLYWAILPHIERWRPQIETQASEALGVPVRIGGIEVRSSGWVPAVELREVTLLDAQLRPALQLSRVVASISARSLLASLVSFDLRLAQLLIEGAELDIRRDAAGRLFIAGLEFSGASADSETGAADWFFRQREVAILGASLRWTDEQRGAPPLALSAVDLVVRNTLRRHDLRLDATPPPAWGERFSVRGEFKQPLLERSGDWQRWSGEAYIDAPQLDAGPLRQALDLPFELSQGAGAVRAWLEVREGVVGSVTLDLALRAVALRLAPRLEPLAVEQLQGRMKAKRGANGGSVSLHQFSFVTGDGLHWPPGDLALKWTLGADGALSGGEFSAARLDLALIAQVAARLPLADAVRALLAESQPQGIANDVQASWDGLLDDPARYKLKARLSGLALAAKPGSGANAVGRPGLRNASLDLDANEQGGAAVVSMKNGTLDLPGVFAEPVLPLDDLAARLRWRIERRPNADAALQVQLIDARLANADLQVQGSATWKTGTAAGTARGGRFPGTLELDATLGRAVAARAARYLPLGVPEGTRLYLQRALLGGTFTRGSFRVKGDLWDFPFFAAAPGEFRIALIADEVTLAYAPGTPAGPGAAGSLGPGKPAPEPAWPPMTGVAGELILDRASLEFRNARARIFEVAFEGLQGGIANLAEQPVLKLDATARGPVADVLRFLDTTPVGDWMNGALREATASGDADLKLALVLPLSDLSRTTVNGSLQLAASDVRVRRDLPLFAAAKGRVAFTNQGFTIADASARLLGGQVVIDGGTQPDGSLRFNARGSTTAEALQRAPEIGPLAPLAGVLSGQANYRLALGLGRGAPEIDLTSDLVGMAIDLPPPLRKTADAALPLHFQTTPGPGERASPGASTAGPPLDTLRVDLGTVIRAQYQRDLSGATPRVLRGGVGVFEPAPTPPSGVTAAATLASLDLDAWEAASQRLFGTVRPDGPSAEAAAQAGYAPTQIGLKAQTLTVAGRTLTRLAAGISQLDGDWRATLNADQLEGYLEYRPPGGAVGSPQAGRVFARLARLNLPKSDADEVITLLEAQPRSVPALDIVIDALELRGRQLGRLEVQAVNRLAPERGWELSRLTLDVPEARLSASGRWAGAAPAAATVRPTATPARAQANFKFELDITDSGALLTRFGTPDAVRGGKGQLKGQLGWRGSPLSPDIPSLGGQFSVAIESGQFLQVSSGAARLLGVLSMQSLARRLTGDFRDLFDDGFAFDSIAGDVAIAAGVARTDNLLMRGPQAIVAMQGSADVIHETQDLRVVVVPEINLGAASLAYAVINPVVGLGSFLAQLFLREPLAQASTREFHITGPWAEPQVAPVAHLPGIPNNGAAPAVAPGEASPGP